MTRPLADKLAADRATNKAMLAQARPRRKKATPTNDLTKDCLAYLALKGITAWRNATTGVYDPAKGRFRRFTGRKGVSDILGLMPPTGRMLAVEVKGTKSDRLSPDQKAFKADVEAAGGLFVEARCIDDLIVGLAAADQRRADRLTD